VAHPSSKNESARMSEYQYYEFQKKRMGAPLPFVSGT
jgi:hypothetical protein